MIRNVAVLALMIVVAIMVGWTFFLTTGCQIDPLSITPSPGYPCGPAGVPCSEADGGFSGSCCPGNTVCGGAPFSGCPADQCCDVGVTVGMRRPVPQTRPQP